MYLDIAGDEDGSEAVVATFKETGPSHPIQAVRLHLDGAWWWCAVRTGGEAPEQASLTPIEESGDGPALLVHGGDRGLRLVRRGQGDEPTSQEWQGDEPSWSEPFLIMRPDTSWR